MATRPHLLSRKGLSSGELGLRFFKWVLSNPHFSTGHFQVIMTLASLTSYDLCLHCSPLFPRLGAKEVSVGELGIRTHLSKVEEEERKQFRGKNGRAGERRGRGPGGAEFSMCQELYTHHLVLSQETRNQREPLSFHSRVNRRDLCSHKSRWHEALVALLFPLQSSLMRLRSRKVDKKLLDEDTGELCPLNSTLSVLYAQATKAFANRYQ